MQEEGQAMHETGVLSIAGRKLLISARFHEGRIEY
jgi:hypothetical protein